MQWFCCGKRGFGLQLREDVRKGTFIVEYVGEANVITSSCDQVVLRFSSLCIIASEPFLESAFYEDASKGYLKLLFLTAASGDCANGSAIQSYRDLSMILDAVLKTRSRVVLIDILSKNGLQMPHNTLKQYRRNFKKIPILRKLLKVLEYLASREILTLEHVSGGPPYPSMESFRESILSLTEHDDKQVHQIARNFGDKYIPKSIRKTCHPDRAPALLNNRGDPVIRPTEAIDCLSQSIPASVTTPSGSLLQYGASSSIDSSWTKSRWDQPGDPVPDPVSSVNKKENCSEDIPPGFSPCVDISRVLLNTSSL